MTTMRKTLSPITGIFAAGLVVAMAAAGAQAKKTQDDIFDFDHVSCTGADYEIRVVVEGVKKPVGLVTADLFPNREEGFLHQRGRLLQVKFAAKAPLTRFCLTAPEAGDFAVSIYHDKNANGIFDKGAFGLPAEPWGVSRNPKVRFGPPDVTEALFPVGVDGAEVEIKLN